MKRWTHFGTSVTPIESTRRRVAGGTCIDVIVHDPRSTITHATINADNLTEVKP